MGTKRSLSELSGAALASATRPPEKPGLAAVRCEPAAEHRAFLLWVMAGGPAYRYPKQLLDAVASTVLLPTALFRLACKNRRFFKRVRGYDDPGATAWETYQRLYLATVHGHDIVHLAADLTPPADSVPILWRLTADVIAAELAAKRWRAPKRFVEVQTKAADSDAEPFGRDTPDAGGLGDVVHADEDGLARLVVEAQATRPKRSKAQIDSQFRAKGAVENAAIRLADAEKAGGDKVVLTRQDARNILRSIVGTPLDEKSLREVDRELLAAARAASPDAEVRLLSLLATQRAEAEAAAADPTDRLVKLVDAAFGYFARELGAGKVKVTMSSLPMLIKARALLTGGATSRTEHTGLLDARGPNLRDSARVADARQSGDKTALVRAMREDVAELSVILDALGEVGDEAGGEGPTVIDVESEPVVLPQAGEG